MPGKRTRWVLLCQAALFLAGGMAPGWGQGVSADDASTTASDFAHVRSFRIGFLRVDPESPTTSGVFLSLREFLLAQPAVRQALHSAGVDDIITQSFDSHRLLVEAMDGGQLDLAFCSVVDYAYQRGNYEPVFQMRRAGDPHSSIGDSRVWHSGVIFVNNRSRLFNLTTSSALGVLPAYLTNHEIAMVGSSSAAGYVYPYLALSRLTTSPAILLNGPSIFWDSSSEVVKAVVNGVNEIGACDASAVDEVLKAYGLEKRKDDLVKVILRTAPVPRDPVVLNRRWFEEGPDETAAAGREISRAVQAFFDRTPGLPRLEPSTDQPFIEVQENLKRFEALRTGAQAGSGSAALSGREVSSGVE